jgi:hypothetical protein
LGDRETSAAGIAKFFAEACRFRSRSFDVEVQSR